MKRLLAGVLLILLLGTLIAYHGGVEKSRLRPLRFPELPSSAVLKIMSLGNKELLGAFIFFQTEFYFGEKTSWRQEQPEYQRLFKALDKATDLDPYNMDCYYFAQGTISDIRPAIPLLNRLLQKGLKYRKNDWYLPFFISANYYFKLNDPVSAAKYLKLAADLKPNTTLFATLTARMLYEGNRTEAAIAYLEALAEETRNVSVREVLIRRLKALMAIRYLEKAVAAYTARKGTPPATLDELVMKKIIKKIPADPYGGTFQLTKAGRIVTTSKLSDAWKNNGKQRNKN